MSSRRTRELAHEELYWQTACERLVRSPVYNCLQHEDLLTFKEWIKASSFQVIYKLLLKLSCWPEGIWRCSPDHYMPNGKVDGSLTVITRMEEGVLRVTSTSRRAPEGVVIDFGLEERGHNWPLLAHRQECQTPEDHGRGFIMDASRFHGNQGGETLMLFLTSYLRGLNDEALLLRFGSSCEDQASSLPWQPAVAPPSLIHNSYLFCCSIPSLPWPHSIPTVDYSSRGPALYNPRHLEGLWQASYGPHGVEIVWVVCRDALRMRVGQSTDHGKLEGLKITGDPNVPAGNLTFEVWSQYPIVGRYDGFEEEELFDGQIMEINRPIVMHAGGQRVLLDLDDRPVAARYFGRGQINADPSRWSPEWEEVQLLVYDGDQPVFSILWSDLGSPYRHMMDFTPAELPGCNT
ncbi:g4706 [Coccomyxa elongata]